MTPLNIRADWRTAIAIAFIQGFFQIAYQIAGSKIVTVVYGSNLMSWTLLITVFLISMALGQWAGGRLSISVRQTASALRVILFFAALWPLLMVFGYSSIQEFSLKWSTNPVVGCSLLVCSVFLPPVTISSMVLPLVLRSLNSPAEQSGIWLGRISSVNSVGSVSGALFSGFLAFGVLGLGLAKTMAFLGGILLFAATLLSSISISARIFLLILFLIGIAGIPTPTTQPWAQNTRVIFERETLLTHLRVVEAPSGGRALEFANVAGVHCQIRRKNDVVTSGMITSSSVRLAWGLPHPPRSILVLGLGGGCLSHQVRYWFPTQEWPRIHYVEIDPAVVKVTRDFFFLPPEDLVTIADARFFMMAHREPADVIFVDLYADALQFSDHLFTLEFFEDLKRHLNDGGALILNFYSAASLKKIKSSESVFLNRLFATMKKGLPGHRVRTFAIGQVFDPDENAAPHNLIFLASKSSLDFSLASQRVRRISEQEVPIEKIVNTEVALQPPVPNELIYTDKNLRAVWDFSVEIASLINLKKLR